MVWYLFVCGGVCQACGGGNRVVARSGPGALEPVGQLEWEVSRDRELLPRARIAVFRKGLLFQFYTSYLVPAVQF